MKKSVDVLIAGAGIAGLSAGFRLARRGLSVLFVDPEVPMSQTSSKSTEAFRDVGWGVAQQKQFMQRSVTLLEELDNEWKGEFSMRRHGYAYLFPQGDDSLEKFIQDERESFDIIENQREIAQRFPFAQHHEGLRVALARNAGWLSAHELGFLMLRDSRKQQHGAELVDSSIASFDDQAGHYLLSDGTQVSCGAFVNAAGPHAAHVATLVGQSLPSIRYEPEYKLTLHQAPSEIPADCPMVIWKDSVLLDWAEDERQALQGTDMEWMCDLLPNGLHFRRANDTLYALWTSYSDELLDYPKFPIPIPEYYGELVLRGLSKIYPSFTPFLKSKKKLLVDGGWYAKTKSNLPLIGRTGGSQYISAAMTGIGIMSSQAGGELVAAHILGDTLPSYANLYSPDRENDPSLRAILEELGDKSGQL